jgi:hypothetical protein
VLTYHALALRLTGSSLAGLTEQHDEVQAKIALERILDQAIALLQGKTGLGDEADGGDELRERLLAGYRYMLVDEYQDIDQRQYDLISALAGRQTQDKDARLTLMAVGDDDQNIYSFRHTSNDFIQRFQTDYQARLEYLVENYRSSAPHYRCRQSPHRRQPGAPENRASDPHQPCPSKRCRRRPLAKARPAGAGASADSDGAGRCASARPRSRWPRSAV